MASTKDLDIIAKSETWLNSNLMDQELLLSHYNIFRKDTLGRGGGVLLAIREGLSCYRRCDLETDCETLCVKSISILVQFSTLGFSIALQAVIWPISLN